MDVALDGGVMFIAPSLRFSLRHVLVACALLAGLGMPARAGQVQLAWDPNVESDLAGYVVLIGTTSRVYTQSLDVGPASPTATVSGLADATTYYFAVRAFNTSGLQSGWSNEVVVTMPGTTPIQPPAPFAQAFSPVTGPASGGTIVTITGANFQAGASVRFGTVAAAVSSVTSTGIIVIAPPHPAGSVAVSVHNPDGRSAVAGGVFNYQSGSAPPTAQPPTEEPPAAPFVRYFAEGVQGAFFSTRFALANPHDHAVSVNVALTDVFGQETVVPVEVPAGSRATLDRTNLPALASDAFGSRFSASDAIGIDRTVEWDAANVYGAHSETGIEAPRTSWYVAEGATHSGFNVFYLLQNSTNQTAEVRVRYLLGGGGVIEKTHLVGPRARTNVWVNKDDPALASAEMSAHFESVNGVPIVVERSMYLDTGGQLFTAGHNSGALPSPATRWFLAEGSTGDYFDTFVLVANPNPTPASLRVTYLLADAAPVVRLHTVAANSRYTIWVDHDDPRLARADVSTIVEVTNDVPVIVERSMWWPGTPGGAWTEAHNSAASTTTATRWVLADGQASESIATYVLVANTGADDTLVRFTLLGASGVGRSVEVTVRAQQRFSVDVATTFREAANTVFGVLVESLDGAPLVVERATYRDAPGIPWAAGTNSLATPLPPASQADATEVARQ